ncbi:carbohydrate ABC transporter permease [Porcincola intestinalis]|jgi:multiple sugar transport system permease protein|uniref:Carbohydrate ABC transporter permease n=2 Tax=Porcincola intestinalis TaxID=2606632 RepID=A0A6L5X4W4_9FIRM|nr:carbohydrate ABC transporter permease [Porcincola intestinalis]MCI6238763.1 carbohydrate ABC transporter permease [Lachnospiraceae bacterium]MCI6697999.1 carbohydrate ABC transporter permease [Lachnospiraceae bacterium]MCI6766518.1 carbohydrate ABC transporter permease [Lachnospiraceae bacterium]MCI7093338.1 carbohydrate ABC transporter permease [Lachnospiraceae bacterium]MDD7060799.1 carbohydrate ABC transporter permease [Porcincola intestinalis]
MKNTGKKALTGKKLVLRILLYIAVIAFCVVILYPYFIMFTSALKSRAEIYSINGTLLPIKWRWSNLIDIWRKAPMLNYFLNSIIIALGSTAIAMVCGIPAAYALTRMKFKGQNVFLGIVIVSQMFAPVVLVIGIYKIMMTFHLVNSLLGLILVNAAFNQAFTVWLLRGTFDAISPEMEKAARIDGCGRVQSMFKVLLPIAAPGIVTTLIFVFINAWNEYTIALTLISDDVVKPLTVGINIFNGYNMVEWQYLFAASLFSIIPVIILFIGIEKNLASGLAAGGVKG